MNRYDLFDCLFWLTWWHYSLVTADIITNSLYRISLRIRDLRNESLHESFLHSRASDKRGWGLVEIEVKIYSILSIYMLTKTQTGI